MKFPVWRTTLEVFDFLWRERAALVRFGLPPVAIIFIVGVILQLSLGEAQWEQATAQVITAVAQALILLPVTVLWYRLTVIGEGELTGRPMFSFGPREWRLLGWQILILLIVFAVAIVCAAVTFVLTEFNQEQESIAFLAINIAWTIGWLLSLMLLMTRLSMMMVLAALDQPVSVKTAWHMTKGLSWRLLGATFLIVIAALLVGVLFKLFGFIVGTITAIATNSALSEILLALNTLGQTLASLVSLLGLATLFGIVYKSLKAQASAEFENAAAAVGAETTSHKTLLIIRLINAAIWLAVWLGTGSYDDIAFMAGSAVATFAIGLMIDLGLRKFLKPKTDAAPQAPQ
jgi:hypothetical protein